MAVPLQLSQVLATVINQLPDSVTLDRIDMDAQIRRGGRSPRSKTSDKSEQGISRTLNGEVAGFAASDEDVAELVARLASAGAQPRKVTVPADQ